MRTSSRKAKEYKCFECNEIFDNHYKHNTHKRYCGKRLKGWINGDGYKMISIKGKTFREHRYLMEEYLGRKLKKEEHIHHINSIRTDNRIENLWVMDIKEHGRLEGKKGRGIPKCQ